MSSVASGEVLAENTLSITTMHNTVPTFLRNKVCTALFPALDKLEDNK